MDTNVHVFLRDTPKQYIDLIGMYTAQGGIMVSADLEGCRNPFPWHDSLHVSGLTPSGLNTNFRPSFGDAASGDNR